MLVFKRANSENTVEDRKAENTVANAMQISQPVIVKPSPDDGVMRKDSDIKGKN